jgi:hypothetical protein
MGDTTFSDVMKKKDVAKLWKLIVDTHSVMGSGQLWDPSSISGEIDRELYENLDSVIM